MTNLGISAKPNKNFNKNLEALRGFAALFVAISHIEVFSKIFNGTYTPTVLVILAPAGHLSVLVFFVLSGYVIAASNKNILNRQTTGAYIKKRFLRIYPIYTISILLILVSTANNYSVGYILLNFLMLQPLLIASFIENGPAWSLHFEVLYYILFIPFSRFRINPLAILIISIVIALVNYALYPNPNTPIISSYLFGLSFWIAGVLIAKSASQETKEGSYKTLISVLFLLLSVDRLLSKSGLPMLPDNIALLVFHKHLLYPAIDLGKILNTYRDLAFLPYCIYFVLTFSGQKFKYQKLFYMLIQAPLVLALVLTIGDFVSGRPDKNMGSFLINVGYYCIGVLLPFLNSTRLERLAERVINFGAWLGSISYAVYIVHCPVIFALGRLKGFSNTPVTFVVKFMLFLIIVTGISYLLERKFQPFVKKMLA